MFAAVDIGEVSRNQVRDRFDDAEAHDEGNDDRGRGDLEFFRADKGDHRPLQPHHAADERIDEDEQRELPPVLAQTELNAG